MNKRFVGIFILISVLLLTTTSCNIFTKPDINRVAKPSFSPEGGGFEQEQTVSIFCSTPGASIFYSVDGSSPTIPYTEPINLRIKSVTLKAVATRLEWQDSPVATSVYNIGRLPMPSFSPGQGIYSEPQLVTISCEIPGVTIRYTTDNTEPNESSQKYTRALTVSPGTELKAACFKIDWITSATASARYVDYHGLFVLVEGGTFNNGTSNLSVSTFYINKYEITQSEYQAVMESNPSSWYGYTLRPVENLSWFNAIEYCNRRSIQEGLTPCYCYGTYGSNPSNWPEGWDLYNGNPTNVSCNWTVNGYRLPTEIEWMFAAMGGNQSHGYTHSGSNTIDDVAWYYSNSGYTTHDIGTRYPNELGIFDMSGNVWEWCWEIYGTEHYYYCAVRGGSWRDNASLCSVSYSTVNYAGDSRDDLGFRVVKKSP